MDNFIKGYNLDRNCRFGINRNEIICVFIYDKECGKPYIVSSVVRDMQPFRTPPFHKEFDKYEDAEKYFDMLMEELNG